MGRARETADCIDYSSQEVEAKSGSRPSRQPASQPWTLAKKSSNGVQSPRLEIRTVPRWNRLALSPTTGDSPGYTSGPLFPKPRKEDVRHDANDGDTGGRAAGCS